MTFSEIVQKKIDRFSPGGKLDQTAKVLMAIGSVHHNQPKEHMERVALLSETVALKSGKDAKAAFFAGLLHDVGKILLPHDLFDGHNIDSTEYEAVKKHAQDGFEALKNLHAFTALCAGLHHSLYKQGYGLGVEDFPKDWNMGTIKKVLEISAIISICDFVDAFTHRKTEIKDGSNKESNSLREMLYAKYPDDKQLVEFALEANIIILNIEASHHETK